MHTTSDEHLYTNTRDAESKKKQVQGSREEGLEESRGPSAFATRNKAEPGGHGAVAIGRRSYIVPPQPVAAAAGSKKNFQKNWQVTTVSLRAVSEQRRTHLYT